MNRKRIIPVLGGGLLALALMAPGAPARAKLIDEVALVVDQDSMTSGEIEESIQALFVGQRAAPPKPGSADYGKARQLIVENFIKEVLLAEEADRMGIAVSDAEVDKETDREIDGMKKNFPSEEAFQQGLKHEGISLEDLRSDIRNRLKRRIKANRAMRQQSQTLPGGVAVTDEEARAHFNKNPQDYEQVRFAVILFRVPAGSKPEYVQEVDRQARQALSELKAGADFAAYAKKYSEERASAEKGGMMGTFFRSELDPTMAKGIFAIPEKGMGVVKAPEGFYIVRVDKKKKADYEAVAKDIKDSLQKESQQSRLEKWFEGLRKTAFITLDGKPYQGPAGPSGTEEPSQTIGPKPGREVKSDNPAPARESLSGEYNPTLPPVGSLILDTALQGFALYTEDLKDFHNPGTPVAQSLPFGFGLQAGLDYALDPALLVGLQLEYLRKFTESVTDSGNDYQWDASVLAPSLALKLLIPMDETTNFVLAASGGYHFLIGGGFTAKNGSATDQVDLSSEALGGKIGGGVEFFLDEDMNSSLGICVDYRFLNFASLKTHVVQNDLGLPYAATLKDLNGGGDARIDLSGVNVGLNLRFYLGKN